MDEERFKMCNNCVFLNGRKDDYNAMSKLSPECGLASPEITTVLFYKMRSKKVIYKSVTISQ